jgi:hypothetical protein
MAASPIRYVRTGRLGSALPGSRRPAGDHARLRGRTAAGRSSRNLRERMQRHPAHPRRHGPRAQLNQRLAEDNDPYVIQRQPATRAIEAQDLFPGCLFRRRQRSVGRRNSTSITSRLAADHQHVEIDWRLGRELRHCDRHPGLDRLCLHQPEAGLQHGGGHRGPAVLAGVVVGEYHQPLILQDPMALAEDSGELVGKARAIGVLHLVLGTRCLEPRSIAIIEKRGPKNGDRPRFPHFPRFTESRSC